MLTDESPSRDPGCCVLPVLLHTDAGTQELPSGNMKRDGRSLDFAGLCGTELPFLVQIKPSILFKPLLIGLILTVK